MRRQEIGRGAMSRTHVRRADRAHGPHRRLSAAGTPHPLPAEDGWWHHRPCARRSSECADALTKVYADKPVRGRVEVAADVALPRRRGDPRDCSATCSTTRSSGPWRACALTPDQPRARLTLSVEDDGPGVAEPTQRVLERGVRRDQSSQARASGSQSCATSSMRTTGASRSRQRPGRRRDRGHCQWSVVGDQFVTTAAASSSSAPARTNRRPRRAAPVTTRRRSRRVTSSKRSRNRTTRQSQRRTARIQRVPALTPDTTLADPAPGRGTGWRTERPISARHRAPAQTEGRSRTSPASCAAPGPA